MKKIYSLVFATVFLLGGILVAGSVQIAYGEFNTTGGSTYRLAASIGTTDTTVRLSSFLEPVSGIPYTMSYLNTDIVYGTIDPDTSRSEFISFTGITQNSNGTASLTGVTRGLARSPGASDCTTASSTLRQSHAGQAAFIISDSPCFFSEYAVKQNNEVITGQWTFDIFPITPDSPAASETVAGIVELATGAQQAAGTTIGETGFRLVPSTANSTSTYNAATAANVIPVTDGTGKIDNGFIATSTLYATSGLTIGGLSNIASTTIYATTTTGTWTKPDNLRYVIVEVVGGGGGGSGRTTAGEAGGGGGGGGYSRELILASSLGSTVTVTVGAAGTAGSGSGGAGGAGGTSSFGTFVQATGGAGGTGTNGVGGGGNGGSGSLGDVNLTGGMGASGFVPAASQTIGGAGGASQLGRGAPTNYSSAGQAGTGGEVYGGGGSGAASGSSNNDFAGGAGAQGIVIITSVFF